MMLSKPIAGIASGLRVPCEIKCVSECVGLGKTLSNISEVSTDKLTINIINSKVDCPPRNKLHVNFLKFKNIQCYVFDLLSRKQELVPEKIKAPKISSGNCGRELA